MTLPLRGLVTISQVFLVVTTGGEGNSRNALKYPTMYKTAAIAKDYPAPNVSSAKGEIASSRISPLKSYHQT